MSLDRPTSCGEAHPDQPRIFCGRSPHPYGPHLHIVSDTMWPGKPQPERPAPVPRGVRAKQVSDKVIESGATSRTGAPDPLASRPGCTGTSLRPWESEWERRRPEWLKEAKAALQRVAQAQELFMVSDVWLQVDNTPSRRAMTLVVQYGLRNGWMREDGARRVTENWTTRDGVSFPLNKLCPIYKSLIFPG